MAQNNSILWTQDIQRSIAKLAKLRSPCLELLREPLPPCSSIAGVSIQDLETTLSTSCCSANGNVHASNSIDMPVSNFTAARMKTSIANGKINGSAEATGPPFYAAHHLSCML